MELTTKRAWSPVPSAFQPKYDVFLSFRGADTRKGFTDHLYGALQQQGIKTFVDDSENQRGKAISPLLFSAIEQSKIALIVFSENYVSTTWCLDEFSKILECMEGGEAVLPIFYDVNPSDAGKQMSRMAKALNLHEERFEENIEAVEQWRAALEKAANLRWKSSNDRLVLLGYFPKIVTLPACAVCLDVLLGLDLFFCISPFDNFPGFGLIVSWSGCPNVRFLI